MPFFHKSFIKDVLNKKTNTLQVRILLKLCGFYDKRVFLSVSHSWSGIWRVRWNRRLSASLTVEAAMVLPLFLFSMVILMMPMKIMNENRKIQTKLEAVGEDLSQYAYLMGIFEDDRNGSVSNIIDHENTALMDQEALGGPDGDLVTGGALFIYAEGVMRQYIDSKSIKGISLLNSEILKDGETIDLVMNYRYCLPFPVLGLSDIALTARSTRRAWIGKEGGKGHDGDGGEEDEIVYVGRDSTRYHRDRSCHYLYNNITSVGANTIGGMRNQSGNRYKPCSRCLKTGDGVGAVYVMPSGEHYHADRNCTAIVAYVRAARLSSVAYLGACSYCSK